MNITQLTEGLKKRAVEERELGIYQ